MAILATADVHFDDNPLDEYRWGLFPWIDRQIFNHDIKHLFILGDIVVNKDNHSSILVNRLASNLVQLTDKIDVTIITGNHDGIDLNTPFFKFLDHVPRINYFIHPVNQIIDSLNCWFLPHTKTPEKDWVGLDFSTADFLFTHQTFKGSVVENGNILDGISPNIFGDIKAKVISGDIHVPQRIGKITYCGAPYHIHFADTFHPRLLLIHPDHTLQNLHFPCLQKHTIVITGIDEVEKQLSTINAHDQVKVRIPSDSDFENLQQQVREYCNKHQLVLCSIEYIQPNKSSLKLEHHLETKTPFEIFNEFLTLTEPPLSVKQVGRKLLEQVVGTSNAGIN